MQKLIKNWNQDSPYFPYIFKKFKQIKQKKKFMLILSKSPKSVIQVDMRKLQAEAHAGKVEGRSGRIQQMSNSLDKLKEEWQRFKANRDHQKSSEKSSQHIPKELNERQKSEDKKQGFCEMPWSHNSANPKLIMKPTNVRKIRINLNQSSIIGQQNGNKRIQKANKTPTNLNKVKIILTTPQSRKTQNPLNSHGQGKKLRDNNQPSVTSFQNTCTCNPEEKGKWRKQQKTSCFELNQKKFDVAMASAKPKQISSLQKKPKHTNSSEKRVPNESKTRQKYNQPPRCRKDSSNQIKAACPTRGFSKSARQEGNMYRSTMIPTSVQKNTQKNPMKSSMMVGSSQKLQRNREPKSLADNFLQERIHRNSSLTDRNFSKEYSQIQDIIRRTYVTVNNM